MGRGFLALRASLESSTFPVPRARECEACDTCHHGGSQTEDEASKLGVGKERIRERPDKSWSKPVLKSTPIMDIDMGGNKLTYGLALIWVSKSWGAAPLGNLPVSASPSVVSTPSL